MIEKMCYNIGAEVDGAMPIHSTIVALRWSPICLSNSWHRSAEFDSGVTMRNFVGYTVHNVQEAEQQYKKRTGFDATVFVCRPEYSVEGFDERLVRADWAASNTLLVSHSVAPGDIADSSQHIPVREELVEKSQYQTNGHGIKAHKKGDHSKDTSAYCPHCGGMILDFNNIGFWYGWALGKEPPYWNDLRTFVFERDKYTCQKCSKRFQSPFLRAHHIDPKEAGGVDGARNLVTLCHVCHPDEHPIFTDAEGAE